ncbi:cell envelope integrity protein CreD [Flavobacterium sp.]|uniref:cell envelope integrity protein CreD n=1 Tax=Flavobacterium sp. TaxID=239 RepID=UPI002638693A|nr:cell envelope integrity protein CreD [Flavobacterium sp.]
METPENYSQPSFWQSNTLKMFLVGILALVLLIPLDFVQSLIYERSQRQDEVIEETREKWGENVYFYGPILKVPYNTYTESVTINQKTKVATTQRIMRTEFAYFFPDQLKNETKVTTTKLNRSNYESVVFNADMQFSGNYIKPDFSSKNIADADIQWEKATIVIKTTNLKSIRNEVKIKLGNTVYNFGSVYSADNAENIESLETGYINGGLFANPATVPFSFSVVYDGSEEVKVVPIGKTTEMHMVSNWHSPSFTGNFLPSDTTKKISPTGFNADWKVLHINRPFSQQSFKVLPNLTEYAFGVDFIIPVNQYQQNERAAKYGFLVIGLTFLVFFLIQTISKIRIHIFQYAMIGLALIMFYTLLISITEHSSFLTAYLSAGSSVVAMISLYSLSILRQRKFSFFIGTSLIVLYSFIYVIIQLENYALLFGSIGLFLILGAVMYFSRKIDWQS